MLRAPVLFLQMNKSTGQLNESFEESVRRAGGAEPKMLQDIVCFVILLFIEADKIPFITGIVSRSRVQSFDVCFDPIAFFHSLPRRNQFCFSRILMNLLVRSPHATRIRSWGEVRSDG